MGLRSQLVRDEGRESAPVKVLLGQAKRTSIKTFLLRKTSKGKPKVLNYDQIQGKIKYNHYLKTLKNKPYIRPTIAVPRFCEENGFYTTKARSFNMSMIKGKDTKPEKLLKKALWHAGVRYKTPKKPLPGKPDISLKKYKLVIFVDGTFWHGYDWENRRLTIKSNREFWIAKIERNMQRDQEVNEFYKSKGWTVLRFWDFEVKEELGACLSKVLARFDTYNR